MAVLINADSRYPVNRKLVRKAVSDTLLKNGVEPEACEVSVAVVGERKMKELSTKYYGDSKKHQILTFSLEDPKSSEAFASAPDDVLRLGDIVLCWPQLLLEASKEGVMVDEETEKLTIHGVKHLLGKHHN